MQQHAANSAEYLASLPARSLCQYTLGGGSPAARHSSLATAPSVAVTETGGTRINGAPITKINSSQLNKLLCTLIFLSYQFSLT